MRLNQHSLGPAKLRHTRACLGACPRPERGYLAAICTVVASAARLPRRSAAMTEEWTYAQVSFGGAMRAASGWGCSVRSAGLHDCAGGFDPRTRRHDPHDRRVQTVGEGIEGSFRTGGVAVVTHSRQEFFGGGMATSSAEAPRRRRSSSEASSSVKPIRSKWAR